MTSNFAETNRDLAIHYEAMSSLYLALANNGLQLTQPNELLSPASLEHFKAEVLYREFMERHFPIKKVNIMFASYFPEQTWEAEDNGDRSGHLAAIVAATTTGKMGPAGKQLPAGKQIPAATPTSDADGKSGQSSHIEADDEDEDEDDTDDRSDVNIDEAAMHNLNVLLKAFKENDDDIYQRGKKLIWDDVDADWLMTHMLVSYQIGLTPEPMRATHDKVVYKSKHMGVKFRLNVYEDGRAKIELRGTSKTKIAK